MKLSELTVVEAARHAVVLEDDPDYCLLPLYLEAAKAHVLDYTGLTPQQADTHPALSVAALVQVADMVRNKEATVENSAVNAVLASFLDAHRVNLIGGASDGETGASG